MFVVTSAVLREGGGAKAEPPVTFRTGMGIVLPEESPAVTLPEEGVILEVLEQPAQGWASLSKGHNQAAKPGLKEPAENIPSPERLRNNFHIP